MPGVFLTDIITSEVTRKRADRVGLKAISGPKILSNDHLIVNCMHVIELTAEDGREVTLLRIHLQLELGGTLLDNIEVENEA